MQIPLSIVNQGKEKIDEYVSLHEELDEIAKRYNRNKREYEKFLNIIHKVSNFSPKDRINNYHYIGLPYCLNGYKMPDLSAMSGTVDEIYTYTKNLSRLVSEIAVDAYRYREINELLGIGI